MIQNLIDGLSLAISKEFEGYEIYDENPVQGLKEPCFLITLLNPTNSHFKNNRHKRTHLFDIQYFPKGGKKECYDVIERLYLILQVIEDMSGVTYEGSNMNGEINGGVVNFFVNYDFFVDLQEQVEDPMTDMGLNQTARS